ncbi:MAG: thiamine-phosphate kinase [Spirochaetia bacterium]|nr:thiamine-phosphate kinase [Spirochaetota bacterium]MDW8112985.1 thiamine-phosphate kinase [Spirochaetia bacterium]
MRIDEFELIEHIKNITNSLGIPEEVTIPNGDDCFGFRDCEGNTIITTDTMVDGIHFLKEKFSAYDIGVKSAVSNLSDISAMGGIPKYALVSLIIPPYFELDFILDVYRGLVDVFSKYNVYIGGGNVSRGRDFTITITLVGRSFGRLLERRGTKAGDKIFVSGYIGDSSLGLEILLKRGKGPHLSEIESYLVSRHVSPTPRIELGLKLKEIATSCIDLSDGLIQDVNHITQSSSVGARIYINKIPISKEYSVYMSKEKRYDSLVEFFKYPLSGGEDYELIFTIPSQDIDKVHKISLELDTPITEIGEITDGKEVELLYFDERIDERKYKGWKHF